jgi:hypothetical protein
MPGGRLLILAVLAVVLGLGVGGAAANPFTDKPAASAPRNPLTGVPADAPAPAEVVRAQGPLAVIGRALLTFQREANRMIAQRMRAIRAGETSGPLLIGILLAFVYGVVHALGPGHGKVVVASYFLARDARITRGFLMGLQIAVCHVLSAAVVVALADLVLRQASGRGRGRAPGQLRPDRADRSRDDRPGAAPLVSAPAGSRGEPRLLCP